jgi:hypothetical protein
MDVESESFFSCLLSSTAEIRKLLSRLLYPSESLCPAPAVDGITTSQRVVCDMSSIQREAQLRNQGNWVHVALAAETHVRATCSGWPFHHRQLRSLLLQEKTS